MLRLPDSWVWDSWYAAADGRHHVFYLRASRGLREPIRRHRHPSVGHAVSTDLRDWTVLPDALAVSESPAFDDWTTWTGSVVRDDANDRWVLAYTGTSRADGGRVQRIGFATSRDLLTWDKADPTTGLSADPRWYETLGTSDWPDEAWRDPFVFRGDDGLWHMFVTARANHGPVAGRGVVGHATCADLADLGSWTVHPPVSEPGRGFGQLEVTQVELVDGVPTLVFCCEWPELDEHGQARHGAGGVFSVTGPSVLGPFDIGASQRFPDPALYAARLVRADAGWVLIGFANMVDGQFVGELVDPIPVTSRAGAGLIRIDELT